MGRILKMLGGAIGGVAVFLLLIWALGRIPFLGRMISAALTPKVA